jgi:hypothetical protein
MINTAGVLYTTGTAYSSRGPGFTPSVLVKFVMLVYLMLCVFNICFVLCLVPNVSLNFLVSPDFLTFIC